LIKKEEQQQEEEQKIVRGRTRGNKQIMAPIRVAILECDTPIAPILSTYGRYGDIISRMMLAAGATMDPPILSTDVQFTKWDVVDAQEYPNLEDVDHIIISGGSM